MNVGSLIPILLLILLAMALGGGAIITLLALHWRRRSLAAQPSLMPDYNSFTDWLFPRSAFLTRPSAWLAIRSRNLGAVQTALGLHNPKPCTWLEGLAGEQQLFIAPPIKGWILVVGSGLPSPSDDVDACFRFLLELSRKLGEVQFFTADRVLNHHAWACVDTGRVVRAYAWNGKTQWNQGIKTRAELELGMKCFHYFEAPERSAFGDPDPSQMNIEKVPLLAARWSVDPAAVDERLLEQAFGIAGEL